MVLINTRMYNGETSISGADIVLLQRNALQSPKNNLFWYKSIKYTVFYECIPVIGSQSLSMYSGNLANHIGSGLVGVHQCERELHITLPGSGNIVLQLLR